MVNIAILGTGNLATSLGTIWARAGHDIRIAGRSSEKAAAVAAAVGGTSIAPRDVASADVAVLAVASGGVEPALRLAGGPGGNLAGLPLVETTNAVDYATGQLVVHDGSFAERVARWAPGAHVVKALHLYAGRSWLEESTETRVVPMCGDDPDALRISADLVTALGGVPAVIGDLTAARQLEEAAGFVMRVVAAGHNPRDAVPRVRPSLSAQAERVS